MGLLSIQEWEGITRQLWHGSNGRRKRDTKKHNGFWEGEVNQRHPYGSLDPLAYSSYLLILQDVL